MANTLLTPKAALKKLRVIVRNNAKEYGVSEIDLMNAVVADLTGIPLRVYDDLEPIGHMSHWKE